MKLSEEEVKRVYTACLAGNGGGLRRVTGLQNAVHWFNPVALRENHGHITTMLQGLVAEFFETNGENLFHAVQNCEESDWTDDFRVAEQLMLLGVASRQVVVVSLAQSNGWPNYRILSGEKTAAGSFQQAG